MWVISKLVRFPKRPPQFPDSRAGGHGDWFVFLHLEVRSLYGQPPSLDTLGDFRIENFMPLFPLLSESRCGTEQKMVLIYSTLLPNSSAGLCSPIFDFRLFVRGLARDRFSRCRDSFE
jgi:hypothetical protein